MGRFVNFKTDVFEIEETYLEEAGIDKDCLDEELIQKLEEYEKQKRPN